MAGIRNVRCCNTIFFQPNNETALYNRVFKIESVCDVNLLRRVEKLETKHCAEDVVIIQRFDGTIPPPCEFSCPGVVKGIPIVTVTKKRFGE